ncbi:MAG: glycoside hydrolase family 3 N-terminal domain-containing protein, partial [Kiritimatiellales bacterium]
MKNKSIRYQRLFSVLFVLFARAAFASDDPQRGTTATASSSRHTDPAAAAKAGTVQCMGVGSRPILPGDANVVLDGDGTTMWWSKGGGEQDVTLDLGYPAEIRTVQIEWGKNFPSEYEIQWSADGKSWQTAFSTNGFQNIFREKSKAGLKAGWTWHEINPPVTAKGLRIRCLKGSGDGYQIVDVFINGCCPFSYEPVAADAPYRNPSVAADVRVRDLLSRMTLREKIRMTAGQNIFFIPGFDRFGLKPVLMCNTSAGIQIRKDMDWDYTPLKKTTAFPVAAALAATWQPELAFEAGQAIAEECRAGGQSILLGPGVNIHRTSTCGRNFEYFSEDPFLTARIGVAQIKGIQSKGVLATTKHYLANNNELVRTDSDAIIDERTLHEIYLPAFEAAVREGDTKAIMSSYNWVNGEKCGESRTFLTDILRGELGYTGMVMSDWGGTEDNTKALGSGQNLIMPQLKDFGQYLRAELAKDTAGTEKKIDEMIAPTLKVLLETGIWQRPTVLPGAVDYAAHQKMVRQIGEQAVTLLKNDGVLPLQKGQKILLAGSGKAVRNSSSGGGSGFVDGFDHVNYLDGLKAVFGDKVSYSEKPSAEAVKNADRVLFFFNMGDREGADRPFELPAETQQQIADLAEKNPNVIVVASTGTSFDMPWLGNVKGLVHCYYLGQEYGASLANV